VIIVKLRYVELITEYRMYLFPESEEYCEWVANEVFADSRRQVFVTSVDLNRLKEKMTSFSLEVLDENVYEPEEKMVERPYSILNVLKKK
jgi:hypothetical protein